MILLRYVNKLRWTLLSLLLLWFVLIGNAPANNHQCINDSDKRSFDDTSLIRLDVDGDGKLDTIRPRLYVQPITSRDKQRQSPKPREQHWIAFDLEASSGRRLPGFFRYQYGTDIADYWVYALVSCGDANRDGKLDLVFYAGDDTSDERVVLVYDGQRIREHSRKVSEFNE